MLTYREKDNMIFKLHPITTITFVITVFFLALVFSQPVYLLGLLAAVIAVIAAAGTFEEWKTYLKFSLAMIMIIMIINALFAQTGSTVLYLSPPIPVIGQIKITLEALAYGAGMSVRLLVIISVFCLYSYAVNPDKAMRLLGNLGSKSVLAITLSTRLFPLMLKDFQRIKEVQRCRGVKLEGGKWWERVRNLLPIVSILLLSCMERSLQLAESMYARGYGSTKRSLYNKELWHPRDYLILAMSAVALLLGLWSVAKGWSAYSYYPVLESFGSSEIKLAGTIAVSLMVPAILSWGWSKYPLLRSKI